MDKPQKKIDYNQILLQLIDQLPDYYDRKPKLLLHACCAPCSSYVIEFIAKYFDVTIYYYNPNIHPREEYQRRLDELKNFLPRFPESVTNKVKLVCADYDPEDFFVATNVKNQPELAVEKERGIRCYRCYKLRMEKAHSYAKANGFDFFTTTLSISPHKDSKMINQIGLELGEVFRLETKGTANYTNNKLYYLPSDFKKNSGYLRSTQISREYDLWRQDYCGCIYSKQNK